MRAGKKDRLITLERFTSASNAFGEEDKTWQTLAQVYASRKPVSDGERWRAQETAAHITERFVIHWSADVADLNAKDRVSYNSRIYDISGVKELRREREIEITAAARDDDPIAEETNTAPQTQPVSLIPVPQNSFVSTSGWSIHTGLTYDTINGQAVWDGAQTATQTQTIDLETPATSGNRLAFAAYVSEQSGGTIRVRAGGGGGTLTTAGSSGAARNIVRSAVATHDHDQAQMLLNGTFVGKIDRYDIWDMTEQILRPWKLWVHVQTQSNPIGNAASGYDPLLDPVEYRAAYVPGTDSGAAGSTYGAVLDGSGIGEFLPVAEPLQHASVNTGCGISQRFITKICDNTSDDFFHVVIAAGLSGSGSVDPGDGWYFDDVGTAHGPARVQMVSTVDWCLANGPAGTVVGGGIIGQGESDGITNWASRARLSMLELRSNWGDFPIVISEIGRSALHPDYSFTTALMIPEQQKLDQDSGDMLSLPRCKYVARPGSAIFEPDEVHFVAETNRQIGDNVADAMLALL